MSSIIESLKSISNDFVAAEEKRSSAESSMAKLAAEEQERHRKAIARTAATYKKLELEADDAQQQGVGVAENHYKRGVKGAEAAKDRVLEASGMAEAALQPLGFKMRRGGAPISAAQPVAGAVDAARASLDLAAVESEGVASAILEDVQAHAAHRRAQARGRRAALLVAAGLALCLALLAVQAMRISQADQAHDVLLVSLAGIERTLGAGRYAEAAEAASALSKEQLSKPDHQAVAAVCERAYRGHVASLTATHRYIDALSFLAGAPRICSLGGCRDSLAASYLEFLRKGGQTTGQFSPQDLRVAYDALLRRLLSQPAIAENKSLADSYLMAVGGKLGVGGKLQLPNRGHTLYISAGQLTWSPPRTLELEIDYYGPGAAKNVAVPCNPELVVGGQTVRPSHPTWCADHRTRFPSKTSSRFSYTFVVQPKSLLETPIAFRPWSNVAPISIEISEYRGVAPLGQLPTAPPVGRRPGERRVATRPARTEEESRNEEPARADLSTELLGTWTGTFEDKPFVIRITHQSGDILSGHARIELDVGTQEFDVLGHLDRANGRIELSGESTNLRIYGNFNPRERNTELSGTAMREGADYVYRWRLKRA